MSAHFMLDDGHNWLVSSNLTLMPDKGYNLFGSAKYGSDEYESEMFSLSRLVIVQLHF